MKKIFCLAFTLLLVFMLCSCGENVQNVTTAPDTTSTTQKTTAITTTTTTKGTIPFTIISSDGFTYAVEDDGLVVTDYIGSEAYVEIPQTIDGKQVIGIDSGAFRDSKVKSVKIPFGVKRIGAYAFYKTPLESVEIPETVTFIGNNAFSYTNLTEFETPLGISTVSAEMLSFCENLQSVIISDNVTQIDYGAFSFCLSLEAAYISDRVAYIGDYAFEGWLDLVIYGKENSCAQQYAEDNGMEFEIV